MTDERAELDDALRSLREISYVANNSYQTLALHERLQLIAKDADAAISRISDYESQSVAGEAVSHLEAFWDFAEQVQYVNMSGNFDLAAQSQAVYDALGELADNGISPNNGEDRPLYTTPQPAPVDAEIATLASPVSLDCREWFYYPIEMPITKDGKGPASYRNADRIVYEVWDRLFNSNSLHASLYDAINEAMRLESMRNTPAAQQQESGK